MTDDSMIDRLAIDAEQRIDKVLFTCFGWQISSEVLLFNGIMAIGVMIAACVLFFVIHIQDYANFVPKAIVLAVAGVQPYINIVLRIWRSSDNPVLKRVSASIDKSDEPVNIDLQKTLSETTHVVHPTSDVAPTPIQPPVATVVVAAPVVVEPTPLPTPTPIIQPAESPTVAVPVIPSGIDTLIKVTQSLYSDSMASGGVSTIGVKTAAKPLTQAFYDYIQPKLFPHVKNLPDDSGLLQKHKVGLIRLYEECLNQSVTRVEQIAYVLTSCYHESQRPIHGIWYPTMSPVEELGHGRGLKYGVATGPYGLIYYGRGDIQTTWYTNYVKFTKILNDEFKINVNLAKNPELCLDPQISAIIAVYGMKHGTFAGVRLDTYINDAGCDFAAARHIVNGTDDAALIASQAHIMLDGLKLCL
jgi:putative chitinase